MLRRLFRFRKKKEARSRWWQDSDERVCPVRLLCRGSDAPDGLAHDQSRAHIDCGTCAVAGLGHQCTATSVDDYEGVSWLEQLERPEWPVPKHCFENRDEDLSVSSCVESIWSQRSRAPSTSAGPTRPVGDKEPWPLRAEHGSQDAVMAKLGLQVTCLGSGSPMSKSYPGRKAVFSAHRGLSLYKCGGDATAVANTTATTRSPVKNDHFSSSTPEPKPGAGDQRNLPKAETLENKYCRRSVKMEDEQGEQNTSLQQNRVLYGNSIECASFTVFHADTSITSELSICRHLEGLLEEFQTDPCKESITLDGGCSDGDGLCGSFNASGVLHASASSGDIKLDHIEDIGRRLHSMVSRQNGGGCSVEEDGRLQLGLGDFDHLGGTIPCIRHRRDVSSQNEVTGSGDCKEGGGGSHLPSTSSPIPIEESEDCTQPAGDEAMATKASPCREDISETKKLEDDSYCSDVTLTELTIGDGTDEPDFDVASQRSSEFGEDFVDADYVMEPAEGLPCATLINPVTDARLCADFAPTTSVVQNELTDIPREPLGSEWSDFDAFEAQQKDGCFGTSEVRPFPISFVRRSASVSGEGFDCAGTEFHGREATTVSAGSSPACRPPKFAFPPCGNEQRQLRLSPACSLDGQVSASSCDSFLTVASYNDDLSLPKFNHAGASKSRESFLGGDLPAAVSPLIGGGLLRSESQNVQCYEDRDGSGCDNEQGADDASSSGEPDELEHDATNELVLRRDGCSSSTTTLSFHVPDKESGGTSGAIVRSQSESSEEDPPSSVQSESPPLSPLGPSSFKSPTLSNTSNHATCSSSVASSPVSLSGCRRCLDSMHNLTEANQEPSYSLRASPASDESNTDADTSAEYASRKTSTPSNMPNYATRSSSVESSPFLLPDYCSCRDFLRSLTEANPELSQSLSESFARDERSIDLDTSVEDACRQIFSSYNESFTQFESVQNFTSLPRFSTTEMLTCPELRPLRLSGRREDVFEPVLSTDPSRRLKRQAVPTASDTAASASVVSGKRTHVSSASSVSMPDMKR